MAALPSSRAVREERGRFHSERQEKPCQAGAEWAGGSRCPRNSRCTFAAYRAAVAADVIAVPAR